jgi:2-polyprenyl-6-methoxyphenol hydroxylase-like FAD-dependent oxidoreductase
MKAIIVGSGIAGLSAYRTLSRIGVECRVYERAPRFLPVGAGLSLGPNGLSILHQLGLLPAIYACSQQVKRAATYDGVSGAPWSQVDLAFTERKFGYPTVILSRHDLHSILMQDIPRENIQFGKKCIAINPQLDGSKVEVLFEDGSADEADLVVGADGARSAVASQFVAPEDLSRRYTGIAGAFGVSSANVIPAAQQGVATWCFGQGRNWGTWSLPEGRAFWFTLEKIPDEGKVLTWRFDDSLRADLYAKYENAFYPHSADRRFATILDNAERATAVTLYDSRRDSFVKGPVVLCGDAAHTVLPFGGQGAQLALEDAAVLANMLVEHRGHVLSALAAYNRLRKARGHFIRDFSATTAKIQMGEGMIGNFMKRLSFAVPPSILALMTKNIYGFRVPLKEGSIN